MKLKVELATPVKTLVLIGGGDFSFGDTREIDELLLRERESGRSIAFLPTASGSAEYATHIGAYFHSIEPGIETQNVPVYRGRDNKRLKNINAILGAGLVYLGGGVTNNLLSMLRETPVEVALRDAASNGVPIAAIGAAASAFGAFARDMRGGTPLPAFGWLANTVIDTGFDAQDDTELRRLMSLPDVTLGIGIPPKTALVIRGDGSTEIAGSGQVAVFRKS